MTVSPAEFNNWLKTGRTGSMCIYHTGFLAVDRFLIVDRDGPHSVVRPDVDEVGRLALNAFEAGKVYLYQRKLHDNEYQYIAMKASRRVW